MDSKLVLSAYRQVMGDARRHIRTLYLFTKSDYKTIFFPVVRILNFP